MKKKTLELSISHWRLSKASNNTLRLLWKYNQCSFWCIHFWWGRLSLSSGRSADDNDNKTKKKGKIPRRSPENQKTRLRKKTQIEDFKTIKDIPSPLPHGRMGFLPPRLRADGLMSNGEHFLWHKMDRNIASENVTTWMLYLVLLGWIAPKMCWKQKGKSQKRVKHHISRVIGENLCRDSRPSPAEMNCDCMVPLSLVFLIVKLWKRLPVNFPQPLKGLPGETKFFNPIHKRRKTVRRSLCHMWAISNWKTIAMRDWG